MPFELPELSYANGALAPYIDEATMVIHRTKHHNAYVTNLNTAITSEPTMAGKTLEELLANDLAIVPATIKGAVRNNGGGHANHTFFWEVMAPNGQGGGGAPIGLLADKINATFGDFATFQAQFKAAAMGRFGSGWAWLAKKADGSIEIYSTPNQDSPLMEGKTAILGLDVWEHAYYLNYQNLRANYIDAFWSVVNWSAAEANFNGTSKLKF